MIAHDLYIADVPPIGRREDEWDHAVPLNTVLQRVNVALLESTHPGEELYVVVRTYRED